MKWIILLIISFLVLLNIIGVKPAKSDIEVWKFEPKLSFFDFSVSESAFWPNAPISQFHRAKSVLADNVRVEISKYPWNTEIALKIAECESDFITTAFNPEIEAKERGITRHGSYGIFQINSPYDEKLFDMEYNIKKAYEVYESQSWNGWRNCYAKLNQNKQ